MAFAPTPQQSAIFAAVEQTSDNLAIVARAGTGKTTTALEFPPLIFKSRPWAEILYVAFGNAIAKEINEKLKATGYDWRKVSAQTTHGMGWGLVRFTYNLTNDHINGYKVRDLIKAKMAEVEREAHVASAENRFKAAEGAQRELKLWNDNFGQIKQIVDLAKVDGFGYFDDCQIDNADHWNRLVEHYDIDGLEDPNERAIVISLAQDIYVRSLNDTSCVDFADMILWPLVRNLKVKFQKDVIVVDEAQDTSRARQALISKFLKPGGRIIVIGDDRQAIMGFAGASVTALEDLVSTYNCRTLPLTVTWRCPKSVVALARTFVPDYEAAEAAPEGVITEDLIGLPADLKPGDAVLCRNVAPLIDSAYALIRQGKGCKVEGRAIGEGLIALAKRWKVSSIDKLLHRLDQFEERETAKFKARGWDDKVEAVKDKCDTLREIAKVCIARSQTQAADVVAFIESLFSDNVGGNVIVLATYHRSKGREWDRVVLWDHHKRSPSKYARLEWQKRQEENLAYVAMTRAKKHLVFSRPLPKEPETEFFGHQRHPVKVGDTTVVARSAEAAERVKLSAVERMLGTPGTGYGYDDEEDEED